jgi:2-methylaconitate cis-trans-isomerase PrpF
MHTPDSLPFVMMRGGTSKGIFLRDSDVPADRESLTALLLDIFGSPDRRQIDGLGGADKLTSKAAIMGPPRREDSDVSYLFGQVGILAAEVDYNLNCGNLTAAAGVYAIESGLVAPRDGHTLVRVHNLNTDRIVHVSVPTTSTRVIMEGDLQIGGVPGRGAPIALDFSRAVGAITGRLLPFGEAQTEITVPGRESVTVSVVDGANLVIYARAESFGLSGIEDPQTIDSDPALRAHMDALRREVAIRLGLSEYWHQRSAPSTPMLVMLQKPRDYHTCTTGELISADHLDLVCRQYASGSASKTLAGTVTVTTGMACGIAGSLPAQLCGEPGPRRYTFGHPSGVIHVDASVARRGNDWHVEQAAIQRTARRIAEGRVFLRGNPL